MNDMKTAIYPGSFDPVTLGHLDIIRRASVMFDRLIVAVMHNQNKQPMFSVEERMDFLRRTTNGLPNVEITSFGGLLADYARQQGACAVVKGLCRILNTNSKWRWPTVSSILSWIRCS